MVFTTITIKLWYALVLSKLIFPKNSKKLDTKLVMPASSFTVFFLKNRFPLYHPQMKQLHNVDLLTWKSIKKSCNNIHITIVFLSKNAYSTHSCHWFNKQRKPVNIIKLFLFLVSVFFLSSFKLQNLANRSFIILKIQQLVKTARLLCTFL